MKCPIIYEGFRPLSRIFSEQFPSSTQNRTNSPHSVIVRLKGQSSKGGVVAYESLSEHDKNSTNSFKIDIPDVPISKKEKPKLPLVTNPYNGVHLELDQEERTQEADYKLLRTKWNKSYSEVTGGKRGMGAAECILPQLPVLESKEVFTNILICYFYSSIY